MPVVGWEEKGPNVVPDTLRQARLCARWSSVLGAEVKLVAWGWRNHAFRVDARGLDVCGSTLLSVPAPAPQVTRRPQPGCGPPAESRALDFLPDLVSSLLQEALQGC